MAVSSPKGNKNPSGNDAIPQHDDPHDPGSKDNESERILVTPSLRIGLLAMAGALRAAVGFQPHSGQDNYHGQRAAYGGDFEAQRHWMELTWHLPISQWYWYDLEYWGLDYPPLTAYVSWLCGALSHILVGPDSVALTASRGYEEPIHKAYMRGTVLILDLLLYGTAVLQWTGLGWRLQRHPCTGNNNRNSRNAAITAGQLWTSALALLQPAILLIDHGHFQYNTVALGLSLWAFYFMTVSTLSSSSFQSCIWGSILFCLALCFKQMLLYYAPAVFFYLLGRCFAKDHHTTQTTGPASTNLAVAAKRVLQLALTVIACFVTLWWPFVVWGPLDTNVRERITHVLRRIFPLQRGLFEGKVSNLWCALSVRPLRLRQRIPIERQPLAALGLTLILQCPVSICMFRAGRQGTCTGTTSNSTFLTTPQQQLLWGATNSALAFFLASFQVHEKSLLLALAPCSLLFLDDPDYVAWFSLVTAWTLWPLMQIDRLQTAYVCTLGIFGSTLCLWRLWMTPNEGDEKCIGLGTVQAPGGWRSIISLLRRWFPVLSYIVMLLLHVAEWQIPSREGLPDLYPVLWSIVGCGFCCVAWIMSTWRLWQMDRHGMSTRLLQNKEKVY